VKAIFLDVEQNQPNPSDNQGDSSMLVSLINTISKGDPNQEKLWTEMIRLLIVYFDERDDDSEGLDPYVSELLRTVGSLTPEQYSYELSYKEKVDVLLYLVDLVHDLDRFRQFLNRRLEDKSQLFKQKNDLHAEIKKIEAEKAEVIAEFAKNENKEE
jgi:hypothetical protein